MIDEQLIQSAINIRLQFLGLNSQLDDYMKDVRKLADFLREKIKELTEYNETVIMKPKPETTIDSVSKHLVSKMEEIEIEEQKIRKKIEQINSKLELLEKDEKILYETIKKRYPSLKDEQIVKEINKHLPK